MGKTVKREKTDRRIIKTKALIRNSFLKLLQKKELTGISISEIAKNAEIDRKTFYLHYDGIYDLVDEIENEIVTDIGDLVLNIDAYNFLSDPKEIKNVLETITTQDAFIFARTLTMNGNDKLLRKFVKSIKMLVVKELKPKLNLADQKLEILVDFYISGMISCYQTWLIEGQKTPLDKLSEELSMLAVFGLQTYLKS